MVKFLDTKRVTATASQLYKAIYKSFINCGSLKRIAAILNYFHHMTENVKCLWYIQLNEKRFYTQYLSIMQLPNTNNRYPIEIKELIVNLENYSATKLLDDINHILNSSRKHFLKLQSYIKCSKNKRECIHYIAYGIRELQDDMLWIKRGNNATQQEKILR